MLSISTGPIPWRQVHLVPQHVQGRPSPSLLPWCLAEDGQGMITANIPPCSHVCIFTDPISVNLVVFQMRNSPPGVIAFPETSFDPPGQPELGFRRQNPCTHHTASVGFLGISKACKPQRKSKGKPQPAVTGHRL